MPVGNYSMRPIEWLFLVLLAGMWGGAFLFTKVALVEMPPLTLVFTRVLLAAIGLHIAVRVSGQRMPRSRRLWGLFVIMGLVNNLLPFSLIAWGQTQITSGLASILTSTSVFFTIALAHFFTKDERATPAKVSGVLLGLSGVVLIVGPSALTDLGVNVLAQLAVLAAAMGYACATIFGRRFAGVPPLVATTAQLSATTVLMVPVVLVIDRPWAMPVPGLSTWAAVAWLALFPSALAYLLYFRLLAKAGASKTMLVGLLIPAIALLLGVTLLGEHLDSRHLAGMVFIGLGLLAIDGRIARILR